MFNRQTSVFMRLAVVICGVAVCVSSVRAAPIAYGDRFGNTVDYLQIVEGSSTDATPLYGNPTIAPPSSNLLRFSPTQFGSSSYGVVPPFSDITDGTVTFTVAAKGANTVPGLSINEAGAYILEGPTAPALNYARVTIVAAIEFLTVADAAPFTPFTKTFVNVVQNFVVPDPMGIPHGWSGGSTFNFASVPELAGRSVTSARVTINNILQTRAYYNDPTAFSFIDKKSLIINVVPEPGSMAILGLAISGILIRRRRD